MHSKSIVVTENFILILTYLDISRYNKNMKDKKEKFSSKMDKAVLKDLREYSKASKANIADILSEAVKEHLDRVKIRPIFRSAANSIIEENKDLLEKLAK